MIPPSFRPAFHPSRLSIYRLVLGSVLALALAHAANAEIKLIERWPTGNNVCADAPLRLKFDAPPVLGSTGKIEVCRTADGQPVVTITPGEIRQMQRLGPRGPFALSYEPIRIDGTSVSVQISTRLLNYNEAYFVRIEAGFFVDFAGIADGWTFTTKTPPAHYPDRLEVAADGSADCCTVQAAVDQTEPHHTKPTTIFIHKGRYTELVRVGRERANLHLAGEDRHGTVITYTNNEKLNPGWIQRAVLGVEADGFTLENLTVQNTTPLKGSQAEAVYINAERCVLRHADFLSTQDTLNLSGSVHVTDCTIEGNVDYVWGYGSALFEGCELRTLQDGYIVQARNPPGKSGYVFVNCKLTAAPEVKSCWLARVETARFPASHVAFIHCQIGAHVRAAGWMLNGPPNAALRFCEFENTDLAGQLLDVSRRDPVGRQLTAKEAAEQSDATKLFTDTGGRNMASQE